jgi:tRNA threonylcarbamoyl adenosine modification protein YjeE
MISTTDRHGDGGRSAMIQIADEAALTPLAARLAAALPQQAFLGLTGDLGAGKTTFVKAVAAAAGIDPAEVVSPTFGLLHEHRGPRAAILHADMYRLAGADDLWELGWHEALARATWAFVEWPERIAAALPADRIDVEIAIDSPTARTLTFTSRGPRHAPTIDALQSAPDSPAP